MTGATGILPDGLAVDLPTDASRRGESEWSWLPLASLVIGISVALAIREYFLLSSFGSSDVATPPRNQMAIRAAIPSLLWISCAPLLVWFSRRTVQASHAFPRLVAMHALAGLALCAVLATVAVRLSGLLPPLVYNGAVTVESVEATAEGAVPAGFEAFVTSIRTEVENVLTEVPLKSNVTWINSWLTFLMVYFVLVGAMSMLLYSQRLHLREAKNAQLQAQLSSAQLAVLRSQLHPHFLFNTLNSIGVLIESDGQKARRTLSRLADLLRNTLRVAERAESSVYDEVTLVQRYVELEKVRFGDQLALSVEVDEGALVSMMPSICLQPLVENSVRHAVGASTGPVQIVVSVRLEDSALVVEVSDDGPGLPSGVTTPSLGLGLRNVDRSLRHLHGDAAGLRFESEAGRGFATRFSIPSQAESV